MQITVDIPEAIARRMGDPSKASQRVREALLIQAHLAGELTRGQVGALLGLDFYKTEDWFQRKGLRRNYDAEDLQADREALDRLLPER